MAPAIHVSVVDRHVDLTTTRTHTHTGYHHVFVYTGERERDREREYSLSVEQYCTYYKCYFVRYLMCVSPISSYMAC